ncbi:hypothetical protein BAUCODRAFT_402119 [Baudoinia panamericana UAMH 10762]|uniref:Major facilitator superfamily (MFS) profile domain-containing protein n=1 Tax=Baudoinia panamericana (strain UAMH 10762) TaxID=717646 RepID=M2NJU2_BAUPA|nr:uncharacterized protein BAUCODRAFT_402119 [Baudoinia panamericana UAMH 10762]EMC99405.1 hypothetical protein BAUCODRAFT_402119 [Baudoinia panamericana UAMH 10762]
MASYETSRKVSVATTVEPTETSPLLDRKLSRASVIWQKSTIYRVLFCGFLVSLTFGVTQVPIIYVFGLMNCEEYYRHHPSPPSALDRCKVHEIEAGTARQVALLGAGTTLFGVVNLFFTGWTIKAFGIKKSLLLTVFLPAIRLAIQNIGVELGAGVGILIVQLSQIITVVGGPVGYMLSLNSLATEVVEPVERTATLGRLSGCAMFGTALGFLAGGLIGDAFGIIWPFRVTVGLFIISCLYVQLCLPDVHNPDIESKASKSLSSFFDPVKMFAPQKWQLSNGKVQIEYGVLLLGLGTFLGVLSTSYIGTLLQMYATDIFDFGTSENGLLIFVNSLVRGLFLTFVFPIIISAGREWLDKRNQVSESAKISASESGIPDIPVSPAEIAADARPMEGGREPVEPLKPAGAKAGNKAERQSFRFDLLFTKYSLIADGLLTGLATFTTAGWQLYVIAVILPLASGTGPAAKGTILQMCPPEQRTDALSAISLVELVARLSSLSVFGLVFAAFAETGQPNLTFTCNAGIAVVGFAILMFARFPPDGSRRLTKDDEDD